MSFAASPTNKLTFSLFFNNLREGKKHHLSRMLSQYLKDNNLSVKQLAGKTGIDYSLLSKFNRGRLLPSPQLLEKIETVLKRSIYGPENMELLEVGNRCFEEIIKNKKKIFAYKIRQYLKKNHLTQKKFAQQLGINSGTLHKYCQAEYLPKDPVLEKIEQITGLSLKESCRLEKNRFITGEDLQIYLENYNLPLDKFAQISDIDSGRLRAFCAGHIELDKESHQKIHHHLIAMEQQQKKLWQDHPIKLQIRKMILDYLHKHQTTATQLAKQVGIHPFTIIKYYHGWRLPTLKILKKLEQVMEVTFTEEGTSAILKEDIISCLKTYRLSTESFAKTAKITHSFLIEYLWGNTIAYQDIFKHLKKVLKTIQEDFTTATNSASSKSLTTESFETLSPEQNQPDNFAFFTNKLKECLLNFLATHNYSTEEFAKAAGSSRSTIENFLSNNEISANMAHNIWDTLHKFDKISCAPVNSQDFSSPCFFPINDDGIVADGAKTGLMFPFVFNDFNETEENLFSIFEPAPFGDGTLFS